MMVIVIVTILEDSREIYRLTRLWLLIIVNSMEKNGNGNKEVLMLSVLVAIYLKETRVIFVAIYETKNVLYASWLTCKMFMIGKGNGAKLFCEATRDGCMQQSWKIFIF